MDVRRIAVRFRVRKGLLTIKVKCNAVTMKINSKATHVSWDGGGDLATGLRATELEVRNKVEERPFSFYQKFPTGFGVQPASYSMGIQQSSWG